MSLDLKAIVAEMRVLGITQLRTSDYEIVLGAPPAPPPTSREKQDPEVEAVEREKQEWDKVWAKVPDLAEQPFRLSRGARRAWSVSDD